MLARRLGEETILVPTGQGIVDLGCLFTLNESGSFLWQMLDRPRTGEELLAGLLSEFDTTRARAKRDLARFLLDLEREGCLLRGAAKDADR